MLKSLVTGIAFATALWCSAALPEPFQTEVCRIFPAASQFQDSGEQTFLVQDAAGQTLGKLYLEKIGDAQRKFGYAGTIEIAVLFDHNEQVAGVLIGKNQETPSYLNRIAGAEFLKQWNRLKMEEIAGKEVDAVTRATYSSEAIKHGVRKLAESHLGQVASPEEESRAVRSEIIQLERRIATLKEGVARSETTRKQLETRKDDELELRLIAATQGPEAAESFAQAKGLIYYNRARRPTPQGGPGNERGRRVENANRGGEHTGLEPGDRNQRGENANRSRERTPGGPGGSPNPGGPGGSPNWGGPGGSPNPGQRSPSPIDTAAAAYQTEPSDANLATLKAAILADYEQRLAAPPSGRDTENARSLKAAEARLEFLKRK